MQGFAVFFSYFCIVYANDERLNYDNYKSLNKISYENKL